MGLALFFAPGGRLPQSWLRPESRAEDIYGPGWPQFAIGIARQAEAATFDAVFVADALWASKPLGKDPLPASYEPFTLLSAMAAATERIGLIGTFSTTFIHPFNMARFLVHIDHLSQGRAGWNIVTSQAGEFNYGMELPPIDERYVRAEEYVELVKALWDTWDDDAVVVDREAAVWAREDRVHPIDFEGRWYRAERAHLYAARSPQGWPVIVQAGQSAEGLAFAARHAEVVFTAQTELEWAKEYYAELKGRAATYGRDPEKIKILPGIAPVIGSTDEEARRIVDELTDLIDMDVGRAAMEVTLQGADLDGVGLNEPIPPERLPSPDAVAAGGWGASRYRNFYKLAIENRKTLRELISISERSLGHAYVEGSVEHVADRFEEWYVERACDGFAITPVYMPEGQDIICEKLVPELQRRGLRPSEYEGTTLRDHLGLDRPTTPAR
jgi:FMN-dependent oxidoreductase (nitrilotriacetate monooxygenase family)